MWGKSRIKAEIKAEINNILTGAEITEEECENPMILLNKLETTLRLAHLTQRYLVLEYNYNYPPVKIVVSMDNCLSGNLVLSSYADSTNRVSLDAEIIKMFSYKDIFKEILHELRHKYQADRDEDIFSPTYAKIEADNYDDYDFLWDIEPKEVDAQNFSYFYSKKFKTKKDVKGLANPVVDKPYQTMYKFISGKIKFLCHKKEFRKNENLENDILIQQKIREYFKDATNTLLIEGADYDYTLSLEDIYNIINQSKSSIEVIKNYKQAKQRARKVNAEEIELSYYNPKTSPVGEADLVLYLIENRKKINKFGTTNSMWHFFTRYLTGESLLIQERVRLTLGDIKSIKELPKRGYKIESEEDIIEYKRWLDVLKLEVIKKKLIAQENYME